MGFIDKIFGNYSKRELKRIEPIAQRVLDLEEKYKAMDEATLKAQTEILKGRLASGETLDDILPEAFATCREAADRVLSMRHFKVQIIGGIVLHGGRIAEMKTGEGKTLVATLAVYLNALSGNGVHVVTVNDYLATRDSEWMGKLYNYLGLTVGLNISGMDPADKQKAYNSDITYGTNNEFGFDYLRDNMVIYKERKVQRGHNFAVVDEVDSILIDEARTPLIISGQGDKSTELYAQVNRFVKYLKKTKVAELDTKADTDELEGDYIVDEKARTATLTAAGVKKAEQNFSIENLMDTENMTVLHHINQALSAHGIMQRDVDYIVRDGEVIIVDAFTGRLMIGRRYSNGLHQAIEAKESVRVLRESKTLATITFQNYFRMYKKLSGMTGTALTEEQEFADIYNLDCIEIPTNKPLARKDLDDSIYKTENGKLRAVVEQVIECNQKGQPVLVGTVAIDKSELISKMLTKRGVKHNVLNAKLHEKEAYIVAQAGKPGAVTIATNMAGRGTDIVLGGNADFLSKNEMAKQGLSDDEIYNATSFFTTDDETILEHRALYAKLLEKYKAEIAPDAKKALESGGLFIIGTERHESRRIDNQLRGRSGRQGDPGASRFFISLEDDLLRLFGGERVTSVMNFLKVDEDTPIEAKVLTGQIESAQRKIEGKNYQIRKNVLNYDDVMNKQREIIYGQRGSVLDNKDIKDNVVSMLEDSISATVSQYANASALPDDWNLEGLRDYYRGLLTTDTDFRYKDINEIAELSTDDIVNTLTERAKELYEKREAEYGENIMRELERVILLRNVDSKWMDHIDAMDELRRGIHLRSYGQRDPVVEYRIEGFEMFDAMVSSIREDTVKMVLTAKVNVNSGPKREQVATETKSVEAGAPRKPVTTEKKIGRNEPCPCGSGKKYKQCHGKTAGQ